MAIQLFVEPRKVYTWTEFCSQKARYSIALDGIVDDSIRRDPKGPYVNFDHHSKADRPSTLATCAQVYEEITMGLFHRFSRKGIPTANIYVNDADEDTCLAIWLLEHHEEVINQTNSRINRLVYYEDKLDRHAGAYPLGNTSLRRKMVWIFEPYNEARFSGNLRSLDAKGLKTIIEAVQNRINDHIFDEGEELSLRGNYEKIGGGKGWVLTKENGTASRIAMYLEGVTSFVAIVGEREGGNRDIVLGKRSVWENFPLERLYRRFNQLDRAVVHKGNKWGGSNTIGGSPRDTGTSLSDEVLTMIINEELERKFK